VFISIKPSLARWKFADEMQRANRKIAEACESDPERLHFVDVWPRMLGPDGKPRKELLLGDGLHMNDGGYEIWAALVVEQLQPRETAAP
jgi:lysophospholipase L1-like esterase